MEAQYLETEEMWFANWDMGDGAKNGPADTATAYDYGAFSEERQRRSPAHIRNVTPPVR